MRIVFCTENMLGGGRERRLSQLILGLHNKGYKNLSLILFNSEIDYPELLETGVKIYIINKNKNYYYKLVQFYKIVRTIKPDIIHSWSVQVSMLYINVLKLILSFKYIAGFIVTAKKSPFLSKLYLYEQISFILSDKIISNSRAGKIAKNAPDSKTEVINNGFQFNRTSNLKDINALKSELGITTSYTVTMVGRISPHKDYYMFIDIAKAFKKISADITFLVVGKGEMMREVQDLTEEYKINNVIFTGFRNDVESIINLSDICVLCSNPSVCPEGISNFIVESMALQKPIVAVRGGGTDEIVINDYNGFLVNSKDVEMSVNLINKLINNKKLRITMGENGKQTIIDNFLLDNMVERYEKCYKSLIN